MLYNKALIKQLFFPYGKYSGLSFSYGPYFIRSVHQTAVRQFCPIDLRINWSVVLVLLPCIFVLRLEIRKRKESESKLESRFLENMKSNNFESKPQLPPTLLKNTAKKFGNQTKADNNQPPPAETEKKQKRGEVPAELKIKSSDSPRTKRIKLLKRLPKEIADSYLNEETDAKTKILSPVNVTTKDNEIPLSKEVKTTNPKREKKVSFKTSPVKHSVLQESVFDEVFEDSKLEQV